jgi:hypothetical protein
MNELNSDRRRPAQVEEDIEPTKSDYRRFLSAVTGKRIVSPDELPLTSSFFLFALPTWQICGASELPDDGASLLALPGIDRSGQGVMGLGEEVDIVRPIAMYEPVRRLSRCASDEQKEGRSGPFRLVTIQREILAPQGLLARQSETYAVRGKR